MSPAGRECIRIEHAIFKSAYRDILFIIHYPEELHVFRLTSASVTIKLTGYPAGRWLAIQNFGVAATNFSKGCRVRTCLQKRYSLLLSQVASRTCHYIYYKRALFRYFGLTSSIYLHTYLCDRKAFEIFLGG